MDNRAYLRKDTPWIPTEPSKQVHERALNTKVKTKLHFKPRSIWPFVAWGFTLFLGFRVLFIPLVEGVYHLVVKSQELSSLKSEHQKMSQQLAKMKKDRDKMKTIAWVEEQSHKAGFIKNNESPMLVIDTSEEGIRGTSRRRNVEIGD